MGNTGLAVATRSGSRATGVDDLVLESKITVPAVPEWAVARPRIEGLVAQGAMGPLTAVTGPPGAGKTMALSLWAARESHPGPIAWVTVDQHDNRPRVFWSYVIAALRRAGVMVPKSLSLARGCPAWIKHLFPQQSKSGHGTIIGEMTAVALRDALGFARTADDASDQPVKVDLLLRGQPR